MFRINLRTWWGVLWVCLLTIFLAACQQNNPQNPQEGPELSARFDPENQQEYGMMGVYVGQGVRDVVNGIKPDQYEFMDMITRETLTVDQMAQGVGEVVTGILKVGDAQAILKVHQGTVQSMMISGAPEAGRSYKTNRGLALSETKDKVRELYGTPTSEGAEWVYRGSRYQMSISFVNDKVIGFRFDVLPGGS